MHSLSLFNEKFPKGDIGGILQKISINNREFNLHYYFDSAALFYNFKDRVHRPLNETFLDYFNQEIVNLMNLHPPSQFEIDSTSTYY